MDGRPLAGQVAVVTGASRGIGRGIAKVLAEAGATVYVTGRSAAGSDGPGDSLAATVAALRAAGGDAIGVPCDHSDDAQVAALFDRVTTDRGKLDLLVNNVFTASDDVIQQVGVKFWDLPVTTWDRYANVGLRSHYAATVMAMPLLLASGHGLVVNVSSRGAKHYTISVGYGVGKAALDRFTADAARELREVGVAIVSVWPGVVRTELVEGRALAGRNAALGAIAAPDLSLLESPEYAGRAVLALATDPDVLARTGGAFPVGALAREYGFTDTDGRQPEPRW